MIRHAMGKAAGMDLAPPPKIALRLADMIEGELALEPWQCGQTFVSEERLARLHRVTPPAVRQAMRVLESQDLGYVRKGRKGGFVVHLPAEATIGRLMAMYLKPLGVTATDVAKTHALLSGVVSRSCPEAAELLRVLMTSLQSAMALPAPSSGSRNRALQIAERMLAGYIEPGQSAGTIDDLIEDYAAGRPTITQAVRILEQLGLIGTARGPSGGLRWQTPAAAPIVKAICPHLRAHDVDLSRCQQLVWSINSIAVKLAASRGSKCRQLVRLRQQLTQPGLDRVDRALQIAVFKELADLAGDRVLHLLIRCLWFYMEVNRCSERLNEDWLTARERAAILAVVDHVLASDPDRAQDAVAECHAAWAAAVESPV